MGDYEDYVERWKAFEAHYGPIPQPPTSLTEMMAQIDAWNRWYALFRWVPNWRYSGWGRG